MAMHGSLPQAVIDALARGEKIEAIRLLRQASGLDLKQSMEAVEAHLRGRSGAGPDINANGSEFAVPQAAAEALQRGNIIEAIKLIRDANRMGLKEAKDAVESLRHSIPGKSAASMAHAPFKHSAARTPTVVEGDRFSGSWLLVVVLVIAALGWLWLGTSGS